ncbi:MAG: hypothetical protein GQ534_02955 [Candidatus Delongbacteria bacterium]|nr:hypothetical protein [Candidatus Delongbacteria bacterium]
MKLFWNKCENDMEYKLESVDLNDKHFDDLSGVYVIWTNVNDRSVIRVGQGNISKWLYKHRNDPNIIKYKKDGTLLVSWAAVPDGLQEGVEAYLAHKLRPLEGVRFPIDCLIPVNLPGEV